MSDGESDPSAKSVVGYRSPPAEHRFKKGASGNPRGRPRKKKRAGPDFGTDNRLAGVIMHEAYRPVQVRENGKVEELPMIQAVIRSLGVAAVKGSHRAQLALAGLVQAIEQRDLNEKRALFETTVEYKRHWQEVFERCDAAGQPRPEPVPHPDDISVNARTGEVVFNGPFDEADQAKWQMLSDRLKDGKEEIAYLREEAGKRPESRDSYEADIANEQRLIDLIALAVPDEKTRRAPGFNIYEWREKERRNQERRQRWRTPSGE